MLELGSRIQSQVESEVGKSQRDYYLREQLKAIQKELGQTRRADRRRSTSCARRSRPPGMTDEAKKEALRELDRLSQDVARGRRVHGGAHLSRVARGLAVVQGDRGLSRPGRAARAVLDEDHSGLEKVKDRILEYLAVKSIRPAGKDPILCFVGPPGVGKTSLGRSIARALGRKFHRISLGGMRDEAEIRGHRRTYIGALPGQIIQGLRRAESKNPVLMLDEIDKLGMDFRGDPGLGAPRGPRSGAERRLPRSLRRRAVRPLAGALHHDGQPPRHRAARAPRPDGDHRAARLHGGGEGSHRRASTSCPSRRGITVFWWASTSAGPTPRSTQLVRHYTREAGLRNLEREIAAITRKVAKRRVEGATEPVEVTPELVGELLGAPRFLVEELEERTRVPGVAVGLAWTAAGGDILFIEATRMKGGKTLTLTGQLGDVMKESAQAALSWVRSHAVDLGIRSDFWDTSDIHVHIPAGAIPKDGPSAGVTMVTALASLMSQRPVKPRLAMTGEVTLSGRVLAVGGIKEKVLAARRAGVTTVILPRRNEKNLLEDVPKHAPGDA